jgi:hypothetical protein
VRVLLRDGGRAHGSMTIRLTRDRDGDGLDYEIPSGIYLLGESIIATTSRACSRSPAWKDGGDTVEISADGFAYFRSPIIAPVREVCCTCHTTHRIALTPILCRSPTILAERAHAWSWSLGLKDQPSHTLQCSCATRRAHFARGFAASTLKPKVRQRTIIVLILSSHAVRIHHSCGGFGASANLAKCRRA